MHGVLAIAAKDLRQRLRDRSLILIAVVVPFTLAAIFGLTLHDVGSGRVHFSYAFVDQDHGVGAQLFEKRALDEAERRGIARVRKVSTLEEGRRLADRGSVAATFVLRRGFTPAVVGRRRATVEVIGDIDKPLGTLVGRSIAEIFAGRVNATRLTAAVLPHRRVTTPPSLVALRDVTAERKDLDSATFYSAGMAVFFLFFAAQAGVLSILEERRDGTLARLLVAPIARSAVLLGKTLTTVVVGVASMVTLALAARFLLGADWGGPAAVALLIVAGVLAATAAMTFLATLARSAEQANTWAAIVALVLGMLGGSFFPVGRAGGLVEKLSLLTPHAWFLRGLERSAAGEGIGAVVGPVGAILAFAGVCSLLALLRVGRLTRP